MPIAETFDLELTILRRIGAAPPQQKRACRWRQARVGVKSAVWFERADLGLVNIARLGHQASARFRRPAINMPPISSKAIEPGSGTTMLK